MIVRIKYKDGTIENVKMALNEYNKLLEDMKNGKYPNIVSLYIGN
jgi:hypothetical protein